MGTLCLLLPVRVHSEIFSYYALEVYSRSRYRIHLANSCNPSPIILLLWLSPTGNHLQAVELWRCIWLLGDGRFQLCKPKWWVTRQSGTTATSSTASPRGQGREPNSMLETNWRERDGNEWCWYLPSTSQPVSGSSGCQTAPTPRGKVGVSRPCSQLQLCF